tara:strand:- start:14625 stop:15212 length:588 start_codon:yes stop_codon:yes gene_type:complete
MAFWTAEPKDAAGTGVGEPKRKFRFRVQITGLSGNSQVWWAKTVTKPSFQVAAAEHKYLNHTFYYPGSVTWQDVTLTLVDPGDSEAGDQAMSIAQFLEKGGYVIPTAANRWNTLTKAKMVGAIQSMLIEQLNAAGTAVESWTLHNAFITDAKFGDLEYGSDELTELSVTLKYDWASCVTKAPDKDSNSKVFQTTA